MIDHSPNRARAKHRASNHSLFSPPEGFLLHIILVQYHHFCSTSHSLASVIDLDRSDRRDHATTRGILTTIHESGFLKFTSSLSTQQRTSTSYTGKQHFWTCYPNETTIFHSFLPHQEAAGSIDPHTTHLLPFFISLHTTITLLLSRKQTTTLLHRI